MKEGEAQYAVVHCTGYIKAWPPAGKRDLPLSARPLEAPVPRQAPSVASHQGTQGSQVAFEATVIRDMQIKTTRHLSHSL